METITTEPEKMYLTNPENNEKIEVDVVTTTLTRTTEEGSTTNVFWYTVENFNNGV
jgi:hypothetical protein